MSAPTASTSTVTGVVPGVVPAGLVPYTEQSTTILLPDDNTAFLNPIQQFNRDLSVAVISTWGKEWQAEGEADFNVKREKKAAKDKAVKARRDNDSEQRAAKKLKTGQYRPGHCLCVWGTQGVDETGRGSGDCTRARCRLLSSTFPPSCELTPSRPARAYSLPST